MGFAMSLRMNTPESASPLLRFENLTLGYNRHPAIHHLNGEILSGAMLAIVGPNGGGKSTLLKGIVGELSPMEGNIRFVGRPENIAYLPQQTALDTSFPISIYDFVAMGLWAEFGAFRHFTGDAKNRIEKAIRAVGLSRLEKRPIGQISGGQLQRARFARVMLQNAPLVLLDEPYSAIDADTVADLSALVRAWNREGRTIISVLHDQEHVREDYPETWLLACNAVARGKTSEVLSQAHLQQARRLSEASEQTDEPDICNLNAKKSEASTQTHRHSVSE